MILTSGIAAGSNGDYSCMGSARARELHRSAAKEGQGMKRVIWMAFGLIVISSIGSCGSAQDGDSLIQEEIRLSNELADALEQEADPAKVDDINSRLIENEDKIDALPQAERGRLNKKYNAELVKAGKRLAAAAKERPGIQIGKMRVPDLPGIESKN